jgi:hypothetical protein
MSYHYHRRTGVVAPFSKHVEQCKIHLERVFHQICVMDAVTLPEDQVRTYDQLREVEDAINEIRAEIFDPENKDSHEIARMLMVDLRNNPRTSPARLLLDGREITAAVHAFQRLHIVYTPETNSVHVFNYDASRRRRQYSDEDLEESPVTPTMDDRFSDRRTVKRSSHYVKRTATRDDEYDEEPREEKHEEKREEKHEEKREEKHEEKREEKHEEKREEKHEEKPATMLYSAVVVRGAKPAEDETKPVEAETKTGSKPVEAETVEAEEIAKAEEKKITSWAAV